MKRLCTCTSVLVCIRCLIGVCVCVWRRVRVRECVCEVICGHTKRLRTSSSICSSLLIKNTFYLIKNTFYLEFNLLQPPLADVTGRVPHPRGAAVLLCS